MLQAAHIIIIALCTGPRDGELADLPRNCLAEVKDQHLVIGYTFKLSDHAAGERHHWPLPKIAVHAIRQQQNLAASIQPNGTTLFVTYKRSASDGPTSVDAILRSFCDRVMLPDGRSLASLCIGSIHTLRFRKTVTRLAALSLVGANQILFDVLGHRDPEMTLTYILSDPGLQADIVQIRDEAAIALGIAALKVADENGGQAALRVQALRDRLTARSAAKELELEHLETAARILSLNGRVMLVKPGVLCTKTFEQSGPCTRRAGAPDIANCRVDCLHRLEMAAAKADHRKAIEQILERIPTENSMARGWWQAQLLAHLMPFADLRKGMLSDSRVRDALAGVSQHSINMLDEQYRATASMLVRAG